MKGTAKLIIVFLAMVHGSLAYDGYQVFKVVPEMKRHVEAINHIMQELGNEVSVWNDKVILNKPVNVHASPGTVDALKAYFEKTGLHSELVIEDMGEAIRNQVADRTPIVNPLTDFAFDEYHPLDEIEEWLQAMAQLHSNVSELVTIGHSYELHPIYALRVSKDLEGKRPVIWLDAGIHAREWVAPATMIYIINRFFAEYQTDEWLSKSLETHDWYFMPVFNVDGYNFTWTRDENDTLTNRLWRKTRTPNPGQSSECYGTDPNRNWDRMWGTTTGISFDPCSDAYCGSSPWSEPSVRQVGFYLRDKIDVDVYFAYHSYSEFYMLPYGYTDVQADDFSELLAICDRGRARIKQVHGKDYDCDSLINLVGANSGSSVDYMYDVVGTKYTFGVELRDNGTYGFVLPPDQILPCAEENYPFLLQVVEDFVNAVPSGAPRMDISLTGLFSLAIAMILTAKL